MFPGVAMGEELTPLTSRFRVARLPEIFVARPRLDAGFADGTRRPVTLVSGPPGAGKTTLIAAALGRRGDVVALTLDWRDNEAGQVAHVVAASTGSTLATSSISRNSFTRWWFRRPLMRSS